MYNEGERHAIPLSRVQKSGYQRAPPDATVHSLVALRSLGPETIPRKRTFNRGTRLSCVVLWLAVLLQAASVAHADTQDITGLFAITQSGMMFNRVTNTFDSTVALTNTSSATVLAPISVVVSGLPTSVGVRKVTVTLANLVGTTADGKPYVSPLANGSQLASGDKLSFVLKFNDFERVTFTAALQILGVPKSQPPPPSDDYGFIYDDHGRLWKLLDPDGVTVLLQYGYDGDSSAPVVYQAHGGKVRWIDDAFRQGVTALTASITDNMTEADFEALLAVLNGVWQQVGMAPQASLLSSVSPVTHDSCVADCDARWAKTATVCTLLAAIPGVPKAWVARCLAAMVAGDLACRAMCPAPTPGPYEFTWCKQWPLPGLPDMNQHPERCGPDPTILVTQGCSLDTFPGSALHPYPVNIRSVNGGFTVIADCYVDSGSPPAPELIGSAIVNYFVLCSASFYQNVAQQWLMTPNDTLAHVCL